MKSIEKIIDKTGTLLTKDVMKAGISKYDLYKFIDENNYTKVAHGIYVSPETWMDEEYILFLRCPQGVLSHDESLYYHGLIDREPMQPTITIYTGYGTSRLIADGIKVFTVKKDLLDIGKEYVVNSYGHKIPIYDLERTICDLVRSKNRFEIQDYQTAIKSYVVSKEKNLNRLVGYAKLFHVEKKIREIMEVLL